MSYFRISTTVLCTVAIVVEADDETEALDLAANAARQDWHIGDIFGEVDLGDAEYEVALTDGADQP